MWTIEAEEETVQVSRRIPDELTVDDDLRLQLEFLALETNLMEPATVHEVFTTGRHVHETAPLVHESSHHLGPPARPDMTLIWNGCEDIAVPVGEYGKTR